MFTQKFLDGSPVPKEYSSAISTLISGAAQAIEMCSEDDLEKFAAQQRTNLTEKQ